MSDLQLEWRLAHPADRSDLHAFECTLPKPRHPLTRRELPHPKPWELSVQSGIRSMNPRGSANDRLLLGYDDEGIGAVALVWFPALTPPNAAKIRAVAVARRHRGLGGAVGREALDRALEECMNVALNAELTEIFVFGYVHEMNRPSQGLLRSMGFDCLGANDKGLQEWGLNMDLPPAD